MTATRALFVFLTTTLSFAAIGGGIGCGLGSLAPGYYRSVFPSGSEPHFDPVSVGLGQGLTQGAVGGAVIGLAVVALLCRRDLKRRASESVDQRPPSSDGSERTWERVLYVTVGLLGLIVSSGLFYLFGMMVGTISTYQRQSSHDRERAVAALKADPAFADVEIEDRSDGGIFINGHVSSSTDADRLHRLIGDAWAEEMIHVDVTPVPAETPANPVADAPGS